MLLLAAATALSAAPARGDGVTARMEPSFSASEQRTDAAGETTTLRSQFFLQRYRLTYDRSLTHKLRLSLGTVLNQSNGSNSVNGLDRELADRHVNLFGNLGFGDRVIGGGLGYTRLEDVADLRADAPPLVAETAALRIGWTPDDLPVWDLRLSRAARFDRERESVDQVVLDGTLSVGYAPVDDLRLRLSLGAANPVDHLTGTDTGTLTTSGQATYSARVFGDRSGVSLGYDFSQRTSVVRRAGTGDVTARELPVGGLSLVEALPATPESSTLLANGALVDGAVEASANVNIGYRPAASGDTRRRHVGVQFATTTATVNAVFVIVDRAIPSTVWPLYAFDVYRSDDNRTWTPVAREARRGHAAVEWNAFERRFEIRIAETAARYLKVVTAPLPPAATTDPGLADVFVTEVQTMRETPAASAARRSSSFSNRVVGGLKTRLHPRRDLFHEVSADLVYADGSGSAPRTAWSLQNRVGYAQRLGEKLSLSAETSRTDADLGGGHEGGLAYMASLAATPLPTLSHVLTYSGGWGQARDRESLRNSVSLSNRAEMYDGISLGALGSYSQERSWPGGTSRSVLASANMAVTPHRTTTLTGGYGYTRTMQTDLAAGTMTISRADATIAVAPWSALALSAGVTRTWPASGPPQTLTNGSIGFSPFRGGDLQLRLAYAESADSAAEARSRLVAASVRWQIRRGTFLDGSYSATRSDQPVALTRGDTVQVSLALPVW